MINNREKSLAADPHLTPTQETSREGQADLSLNTEAPRGHMQAAPTLRASAVMDLTARPMHLSLHFGNVYRDDVSGEFLKKTF